MTDLTTADLERLTTWDTPTICNALEIVVPERRGHGFTTEQLVPLDPDLAPICGYARTATIRAAHPSDETKEESLKKRVAYYEYVAQAPGPTITVIQDLDPVPGVGAFWGEVNTSVHKGLGSLGAVTNGSIRDIQDSARDFNLLGGKIGPSHAYVHVVDFGGTVNVFGMAVSHGDIIHADHHGAVMVPAEAVKKLPDAVAAIANREARILDATRAPDFGIEKLKAAMGVSRDIH